MLSTIDSANECIWSVPYKRIDYVIAGGGVCGPRDLIDMGCLTVCMEFLFLGNGTRTYEESVDIPGDSVFMVTHGSSHGVGMCTGDTVMFETYQEAKGFVAASHGTELLVLKV